MNYLYASYAIFDNILWRTNKTCPKSFLNAGRINVNMYVCGMYLSQCETIFSKIQMVGPIHFKTPRKCNVFEVCFEGSSNYFFFYLWNVFIKIYVHGW
jgi:hypothetical protein